MRLDEKPRPAPRTLHYAPPPPPRNQYPPHVFWAAFTLSAVAGLAAPAPIIKLFTDGDGAPDAGTMFLGFVILLLTAILLAVAQGARSPRPLSLALALAAGFLAPALPAIGFWVIELAWGG